MTGWLAVRRKGTTMKSRSDAQILEVSEADYRNDRIGFDGPSLNYSIAKVLVTESPLHAKHLHPRLDGQKWEPTPESDAGLVFHSLLLEGGRNLSVIDADDWRTKAAKDARDAARAAHLVPVLASKIDETRRAVETIRSRMLDLGLALDGQSELPVAWLEKSAHGPVLCRAKIDHVKLDVGRILDIKTTGASVAPDECARRIYDSGYDIQFAANSSWLEKYVPDLVGRTKFVFVFCERNPPYAVTPVELDGQFKHLGRQRWQRAVERWSKCLATKSWPAFVSKVTTVEPLPWVFSKEQEVVA